MANPYYEAYVARMSEAPTDISRFCDPALPESARDALVAWLRALPDDENGDADNGNPSSHTPPAKRSHQSSPPSMQLLQIRYAFSVPDEGALARLAALPVRLWLSAGAGAGYWESLLIGHGIICLAFDANLSYPPEMRHTDVITAGAHLLRAYGPGDAAGLLLAWPDTAEESSFGADCVRLFRGRCVVEPPAVAALSKKRRCGLIWGWLLANSGSLCTSASCWAKPSPPTRGARVPPRCAEPTGPGSFSNPCAYFSYCCTELPAGVSSAVSHCTTLSIAAMARPV